ncbi:LacI family DNA-binding transcriptional regulator [Desertivirga arenae]|uniref:LacI family DNA-binding transcriptional regulator n=1 Tax=Desertivirga arenae TaxID=2810309 RepID=UPI001A958475|nr:substrate-binding domain-containing protein [Pedobacter sp. SYSU D00823]
MPEKPSIKSIAKELGVSATTVSLILNGKGPEMRISKSMTDLVNDFVRKTGYKKNQLAKSLSTGKSMTIGLLVENISDVFFSEIAYHIGKIAFRNGYKVIYGSTENDPEIARGLLDFFRNRMVDGLIIAPPPGLEREITELVDLNYPVVLFDRFYPEINCSYVVSDNYESTYAAVIDLIDQGNKNVAIITTNSRQQQMTDRCKAYMDAIKARQLESLVKEVAFVDEQDFLEVEIKEFLKSSSQLDAIFFSTHYLALVGIRIIREMEAKIPKKLSIASYDDLPIFDVLDQPVSSIRQPVKQMSMHVMQILLESLQKDEEERLVKTLTLASRFIKRRRN